MMETFAIIGYIVAAIGLALAAGWFAASVVARFHRFLEREENVARAASGMDEFSAPEGGQRHD